MTTPPAPDPAPKESPLQRAARENIERREFREAVFVLALVAAVIGCLLYFEIIAWYPLGIR